MTVPVQREAGERKIEGSHLLVAVGRIANMADIGLDKAGVAVDARGFVQVDERVKTTAPGVWAVGAELPYAKLGDAVIAHLTVAEGCCSKACRSR
jgi:pyruvate/2-oxoglutarate dehydrogenase complex dihydrolipoamide dehydrogenase (E3) component